MSNPDLMSRIFPESLMVTCSKCGEKMFGGIIVQLTKHWMESPKCKPKDITNEKI
jgi:hypothetical protein